MPMSIGITKSARLYGICFWMGSLLILSRMATAKIPIAAASIVDAPAPSSGTPCAVVVVLVLVQVGHPTVGSLYIAKPATDS